MPSKNLSPVSFNIFIDLPSSCMKIQLNNYLSQKKIKIKIQLNNTFLLTKGFNVNFHLVAFAEAMNSWSAS